MGCQLAWAVECLFLLTLYIHTVNSEVKEERKWSSLLNDVTVEDLAAVDEKDPRRDKLIVELFHASIRNDNAEFVAEVLAQYGYRPAYQVTLGLAVIYGRLEIVQSLVNHGADVKRLVENGFTLLDTAVILGRADVAECLLEMGVGSEMWNVGRSTLLHAAAANGDRRMVELLLAMGQWGVNERDEDGYTPLHSVAASRIERDTKELADHQEELNAEARNPLPTLRELFDGAGTAEVLLAAGANWRAKGGTS